VDKKTVTMKQIIHTMQEALNEAVKQDETDLEQLTDVDNAFNAGWQSGMELAIFTLQTLANEYIINNLEDK